MFIVKDNLIDKKMVTDQEYASFYVIYGGIGNLKLKKLTFDIFCLAI